MPFKINFIEALSFNYKLSKMFGLCQFTINYKGTFEAKTTRADILVLLFWSIFYGYDCLNIYSKPADQSKYTSTIYFIGISIIELSSILIHICVFWINFMHRKKTIKILRNIHDAGQKVRHKISKGLLDYKTSQIF